MCDDMLVNVSEPEARRGHAFISYVRREVR